jgi:hypothetical protein
MAVSVTPVTTAELVSLPSSGGLDLLLMVAAQAECTETQEVAASTSLNIKFFPSGGKSLMCYVSLANPRPVEPVSFLHVFFNKVHSNAHPASKQPSDDLSPLCERHGGGHHGFLQGLPEVHQRKSHYHGAHAGPAHPASGQAVLSCPHRHSGSSTSLTWRLHPSTDHGGQKHKMGRSGPLGQHHRWGKFTLFVNGLFVKLLCQN